MPRLPLTARTRNSKGASRLLEFTKFITPDGAEFQFNTSTDRFIFADQGLGLPPVTYYTQSGPFQDGATVTGYTYQPRIVQMIYVQQNDNQDEYWQSRYDLIDFLRQNRQLANDFRPSILRKVFMDNTLRDLFVFVDQGPVLSTSGINEWDRYTINDPIRFVAFDPIFFEPCYMSATMTFEPFDGLIFPVAEPIEFNGAGAETDFIVYDGTYKTHPYIVITGPASNPVIENLTTDQRIELQYIIGTEEVVTIETGLGNFKVRTQDDVDLRGLVTIDTDPLFSLAPAPTAPGGRNSLSIAVEGSTAATSVVINYWNRYVGI